MTEYLGRSAWADSDWSRGGARLTGDQLVGIAWHWPGTSQNRIGDPGRAAIRRRLRGYRDYHVLIRGWSDIGYNAGIDQGGRVWDLRGLGRVGAHCASDTNPDANHEWLGVLLILGDEEEPSDGMVRACQDFRRDVFLERWPGRTRNTGHGRAPGVPGARTSCPGPHVAELIVDGVFEKEEDDMPSPRDWSEADREAVSDVVESALRYPTIVTVANGEDWNVAHVLSWLQRRAGGHSDLFARVLANQQAIMASQGVDVDEDAVARQVAAVVTPAVLDALGESVGLTADQVEQAAEQAVRDVLREGVDSGTADGA